MRTMSVEDAGRVLGVSRGVAYEAARCGTLPAIRLGRRIVVPVAALEQLLGERPGALSPRLAPQVGGTPAVNEPHPSAAD